MGGGGGVGGSYGSGRRGVVWVFGSVVRHVVNSEILR